MDPGQCDSLLPFEFPLQSETFVSSPGTDYVYKTTACLTWQLQRINHTISIVG